jgi:hypothetical protein
MEQGRVGFRFIKQLNGRVSGRGEGHVYRRGSCGISEHKT